MEGQTIDIVWLAEIAAVVIITYLSSRAIKHGFKKKAGKKSGKRKFGLLNTLSQNIDKLSFIHKCILFLKENINAGFSIKGLIIQLFKYLITILKLFKK